jgi:flavin reductase (DIM6/NTAB) family NADH-FMN oxidoreductase RutF
VTIHSGHPFAPDNGGDPLRRFRGRMPSAVSVWTAEIGGRRAGWTLSSFLVAQGDPAEVVGILDEDSNLADLLTDGAPFTVNLLAWPHRALADAFAGVGPAPGGAFRLAEWTDGGWGPALVGTPGWLGARVTGPIEHAGWGLLIRAAVEHVAVPASPAEPMLAVLRGRYRAVEPATSTDR